MNSGWTAGAIGIGVILLSSLVPWKSFENGSNFLYSQTLDQKGFEKS